jgi:single-strand DNA-binding protein
MARGVNKVILVGNVGNDPKNAVMPNGSAVSNFTLATVEEWKDKQTNEKKERVEWHKITVFGKLAEIAASHVNKGDKLYIEGQNRTRSYDDNGITRWVTEVIVNNFVMLGSGSHQGGNQEQQYHGNERNAPDAGSDDDI